MTTLTPLPAIALAYFLYVAVTEGFTLVNTLLAAAAAVLFVLSLKRTDKDEVAEDGEEAADAEEPEEFGDGSSNGGRGSGGDATGGTRG